MHALILAVIALSCLLFSATAQDAGETSKDSTADAIFKELTAGLPKDGQRAISARLELEYWHEYQHIFKSPVRKAVKTKDGKSAEVIFLTAPAMSMPGTDFSMAFLLVDKKVIDWASCWTYNRIANQELLLEDVDGDGFPDVAFRASKGWWGLLDKRQHGRPDDERKWLYAYAITAKGFQSLFPNTDHDLRVKMTYDTVNQPIELQVKGLPETLRERQMVECTLSVTNKSDEDLAIDPGKWFSVDMNKAAYFMSFGRQDKRTVLKPKETVSQVFRLHVYGVEKEVTMQWKFAPSR